MTDEALLLMLYLASLSEDPKGFCERNNIDPRELFQRLSAAYSALLASIF